MIIDRKKLVAELQEDFDLLMDDTEPTAEEIKIANDISVVLALLKEQETEIRQLRLALDIAKGTYKGIVMEGR